MDTDVGTENVNNNRLYASCSSCGHILGQALSGSDNDVDCPKCGAKINYRVAQKSVTATLLKPSTKRPTNKSKMRSSNKRTNLAGQTI